MPIPTLHLKSNEDDEEQDEAPLWKLAVKRAVLLMSIGGIVFFFMKVDKEKLTAQLSFIHEVGDWLDRWIAGAAETFARLIE